MSLLFAQSSRLHHRSAQYSVTVHSTRLARCSVRSHCLTSSSPSTVSKKPENGPLGHPRRLGLFLFRSLDPLAGQVTHTMQSISRKHTDAVFLLSEVDHMLPLIEFHVAGQSIIHHFPCNVNRQTDTDFADRAPCTSMYVYE